eukprot:6208429-Pleurochrysis_carterae.AAC.1
MGTPNSAGKRPPTMQEIDASAPGTGSTQKTRKTSSQLGHSKASQPQQTWPRALYVNHKSFGRSIGSTSTAVKMHDGTVR